MYPRNDNDLQEAALDAAQAAWALGYRPCEGCGCWDLPKHMCQAIDAETGEPCHYCNVCVDRMPHTAQVVVP